MSRLTLAHGVPASNLPRLLRAVFDAWFALGRARRRFETIARLRQLSDHQLRDIGLERGAVERYEALNGDAE